MSDQAPTAWFHSNRYSAQAACEHCGSAVRHEPWCMMLNTEIFYAYKIVIDPTADCSGCPHTPLARRRVVEASLPE